MSTDYVTEQILYHRHLFPDSKMKNFKNISSLFAPRARRSVGKNLDTSLTESRLLFMLIPQAFYVFFQNPVKIKRLRKVCLIFVQKRRSSFY